MVVQIAGMKTVRKWKKSCTRRPEGRARNEWYENG